MAIASINPATGEVVRRFDPLSASEIDNRLDRAATAARVWRHTPLAKRTAVVKTMGDILLRDRDRYAAMMTLEMGKPIKAARDEATKCADGCHWFAEHTAAMLAPQEIEMD